MKKYFLGFKWLLGLKYGVGGWLVRREKIVSKMFEDKLKSNQIKFCNFSNFKLI
jgi:hypothetical protein